MSVFGGESSIGLKKKKKVTYQIIRFNFEKSHEILTSDSNLRFLLNILIFKQLNKRNACAFIH